ncbi:type IV pilus modification PilV family protein [Planococcus shenhongbingii]|uniref:Type II secretion system protein n=1 Tax=Planococcus shenhongbingii TaxID=3058398 RepID=A0ABT8NDG8_9BACL|nr:type II secretion system protein [Planococcus sp. N017]MDN7245938.1 type II secretion system protein [Planococcus sp. N017]
MKKLKNNEKGLTLVEILATLVLLGIVFVGIMTVFSQMTLFNDKTYTKLDTMNLARQEISEIKGVTYPKLITEITAAIEATTYAEVPTATNPYHLFTKSEDGYTYELRLYKNPKLVGEANIESLYQVHLMVKKDNKLNSETYGYIESR